MKKQEFTTISIEKGLAKEIKEYKLAKLETYNEIIKRLLEHINNDNNFKKVRGE